MGSTHFKDSSGQVNNRNSIMDSKNISPSSSSNYKFQECHQPVLTRKQKEILRGTWHMLQNDIARVGVVTFIGLFETHPEYQDTFLSFRGLSNTDMKNSSILKAHSLRVMTTVDKCLTRLDSDAKLDELLQELGHRHISYNVNMEYIDMMGEQFVKAIEPKFGDSWSQEVEDAWKALFSIMTYYMKRGILIDT